MTKNILFHKKTFYMLVKFDKNTCTCIYTIHETKTLLNCVSYAEIVQELYKISYVEISQSIYK